MNKTSSKKIENLNRPVTSREMKLVILNLSSKQNPGLDGFNSKLHQTFKDEIMSVLHNLFQKVEEGIIPTLSMR